MSRLFNLKTSRDQLSHGNAGMGQMHYVQYAPSRDVTGNNFPNGAQYIRWSTSGTKWWIPRRTSLRMRCRITDEAGNAVDYTDNMAPNMSLMACLYQSIEFRMGNQTVCRISDYLPQIDMLKKRLSKSKSWLDSTGADSGMYQSTFGARQKAITRNGEEEKEYRVKPGVIASTIAILGIRADATQAAANAQQNHGQYTGAAGFNADLAVGDIIETYDAAGLVTYRGTVMIITDATHGFVAPTPNSDFVATALWTKVVKEPSKRASEFGMTWQPPLGIFSVDHAIPSGNFEIVLNPQQANSYQKLAIESLNLDKDAGANAGNFNFEVVDLYLYVCQVDGARVNNLSYLLDLEETGCQKRQVQNNTGLQQEEFTVSPSTCALTLAFQDNRTGANTLYSPARFKIEDEAELNLRRMYLNYAGINKPQPDADPNYSEANQIDYTTQRWIDSYIYSGAYFSQGGCETLQDWHDRGAFYYYYWPKDGTDESTRVFTNYQFNPAPGANAAVLMFNSYKKVALVKIENGRAVQTIVKNR